MPNMTIIGSISLCVLGGQAAAQEWQVFFDSRGFEQLPLGPVDSTPYSQLLPHILTGAATGRTPMLPQVVELPEPARDQQSVRLEATDPLRQGASLIYYAHQTEAFGPDGYRGFRVSCELYHHADPLLGLVTWGFGVVRVGGVYIRGGEPVVELVQDLTTRLEPVFDEWVEVSITLDFEHGLIWGSYDGHESEVVPLPIEWYAMNHWRFAVVNAFGDPPGPVPDIESAWLDNLVIEVIPPCPADCDIDYAHTLFDFLCFQNQFAAGSLLADCDGDGELTLFDFLCFQDAFAAGCS